jgi:formamidopyrimidine-DNA glycosylase
MIELPEAIVLAGQINATLKGKRILEATFGHTPHKLVWYYGSPEYYTALLARKSIGTATGYGSIVEISVDGAIILLGEGVGLRFHNMGEPRPQKHQLLIEFDDYTALSGIVQMYGGLGCFKEGTLDNPYYKAAREKPSPLSNDFSKDYFNSLVDKPGTEKFSAKAFLATEQRIPGLGNGVLQDILFNAKIHPKKKFNSFSSNDREAVFICIKSTLSGMTEQGGRDTEQDLFGRTGGYKTVLSKNTVNQPCPVCGTLIKKEAYLGGSIYYCEKCQRY